VLAVNKELKTLKVVFGELEEMLSELKEKEITEVRVDALFQEKNTENQGILFLKAFVSVGAMLKKGLVAHFEEVIFKNLKPLLKQDVEPVIRQTLQAENEIKQSLAGQGFTVRDGYFAEAVS
jgi:hypothetical protein